MTLKLKAKLVSHLWWTNIPFGLVFMSAMHILPVYWIWTMGVYVVCAIFLNHYFELLRYSIARQAIELDHVIMYNRASEALEEEMLQELENQGADDDDEEDIS